MLLYVAEHVTHVDNLYLTVSVVGTSYIFKTMRWRGGGESLPFTDN